MDPNAHHLREIPRSFYSFHEDRPFSHCIECDKYLLNEKTEYLVEKVIRNYKGFKAKDVILDYAICLECAMKLQEEMSLESQKKLQEFFMKKVDLAERKKYMDADSDVESAIGTCLINGSSQQENDEFQLCAHCIGDKLFMGNPPYMVSGAVMDEIHSLLSVQTQDLLNGFYKKHFSPAPGLFEPDPKLILF